MTKNTAPQLYFDAVEDRWVLWMPEAWQLAGDDRSYALYITHAWDGKKWDNFEVRAFDMGNFKIIEPGVFERLCIEYTEHTGEEPDEATLNVWFDKYEDVHASHPAFKLIPHWEAMMTLGLFIPHVNHK